MNVLQAIINGGSLEKTVTYTTTSGSDTLTYIARTSKNDAVVSDKVRRLQLIITDTATNALVSGPTVAIQRAGRGATDYNFDCPDLATVASYF